MNGKTPKEAPPVYAMPIQDRYLLYVPTTALAAWVNAAAVQEVGKYLAHGKASDAPCSDLGTILQIVGLPDLMDPLRKRGPLAPIFLGIIPSRRCNMSCRYCDFRAPVLDRSVMDPAVAVHAIDFIAQYCERRRKDEYEIQFFGGEPFVEDRIIDTVVHHALHVASRIGVFPVFVASTNGLLSASRSVFAGDYLDKVVVSLDGFREFHDCYRPISHNRGSFDEVVKTAHYLSTAPAQLAIRCCVTSESVHHMEPIARWLCEEFRPSTVNFEPLTESADSREAGLCPPSPHEFARHALRAWRVLRSYGCEPACAAVLTDGVQNSSCPLGKDAMIVHPDGVIASCYLVPDDWKRRGMDLTIGRVLGDGRVDIRMPDVLRLRRLIYSKPRCERCFCYMTCAGGCHVNNSYPSCPDGYGDFCVYTRALTACTLLEELGLTDVADELVTDRDAVESLSARFSDRVVDFVEGP